MKNKLKGLTQKTAPQKLDTIFGGAVFSIQNIIQKNKELTLYLFKIGFGMLDMYNRKIVCYELSVRPILILTLSILNKAFRERPNI